MNLAQWWILVTSASAVFVTQQVWRPSWHKMAPIFGLLGQPAWLFETYSNMLPGMFVVSVVYTAIWSLGLYNFWILPRKQR